jgi:hypothetical protein
MSGYSRYSVGADQGYISVGNATSVCHQINNKSVLGEKE